jgi:5-formyltetrahydrofolate cyclo-ligase
MIDGEKQRLRDRMRKLAAGPTPAEKSHSVEVLCRLALWDRSSSILLYTPIAGEPDPLPLMQMPGNRSFLFPKITGDRLEVYRHSAGSLWTVGPFGIREPDPESWEAASPAEVDLALVPGLAFDPKGGRLGRGKGFYDRLLGDPGFRGIKIGFAWEWQIIGEVPGMAHDIRMDFVLAGEKIYDPGSRLDKPEERG